MMSAPFTGAGGMPKPQPNLVLLSRSDGLRWTTEAINAELGSDPSKGQVSEPISEDLNQIPHEETRTKLLEWKEAVGNGLSQQLGWPKESPYLVTFPENFCLRWYKTGASTLEARMYGHPRGFTDDFVYKEPHEFVPHALWLLSGSVDHMQCLCKPCHRATDRQIPRSFKERMDDQAAELDSVKTAPANASESKPASKKGIKNTAGSKKKNPVATTGTPAVKSTAAPPKTTKEPTIAAPKQTKKVPVPRGPQTTNLAAAPISTPASAPSGTPTLALPLTSAQAATTTPTPVAVAPPAAAPVAPHPALNDEPTLFRRGEMVWYQQEKAWRIGIIRHVGDSYAVVPLGHALVNLPDVQKLAHQMRPFLTFSVPSMQLISAETAFDQVQWQDLFNDPAYAAKGEMVALEASKLAAIEIDGSWSTFNQLPPGSKQPKNESSYGGVFLGAEMIRIGDPIRPKDKSRGRLLEVVEISVKATTSVPNPADPANTPPTTTYTLSFRGVEYEANIAPEQGRINAQPVGAIFQKDTAFRTAAARAGGAKQKCVWVIKSWDTVWLEPEVGGRSYVTDELINVTQGPQAVETAKHTGQFAEASAYLNNRMQNPVSRDLGRRVNRRETIGAAIAPTQPLVFGDGLLEQ